MRNASLIRRPGLTVAILLLPGVAAAATITSHPVPQQSTDCVSAAPAAAFTGHALFEYRIEATGAVQGIKLLYSDVRPPDRKAGYLSEVQACLGRWKFKPATVDGVAAATSMMVAFHHLPPAATGDSLVMMPGGKTVSSSVVTEVRAATLAFTETLLKGKGYLEARGAGWWLRSDLPKGAVEELQKSIEFARGAIDAAFPGKNSAGPADVTLIVFRDEKEYQQLSAFDNVIPGRAPVAGQYDGEMRVIYSALGDQPVPIFARTMAHEATHHFSALRLSSARQPLPRWLGEGIAQYVECLKMAKPEKIRLDSLDRGQVAQDTAVVTAGGAFRGAFVYPKRAEAAFSNLDGNLSDFDFEAMLDGRFDAHFFDEGALAMYDVSWLLVHYLMNGESGRHRAPFRAWAIDPTGERNAATLSAALGLPTAEIPARLKTYLGQIR